MYDSRTLIYELCRRTSDNVAVAIRPTYLPNSDTADTDPYHPDTDPPGPNCNVVAYNPALTSALGCNTATYPLGNTNQAKSTCFYLIKYITKDATALTNTLSCLLEAKQCIEKYPSRAEDSGSKQRTAIHLITRTPNNLSTKMEVSAAMTSASLLGLPSTISSHDFWYVFIWPAVKAASLAQQHHFGILQVDDEEYSSDDDEENGTLVETGEKVSDVFSRAEESFFDDCQQHTEDSGCGEISRNKEGHIIIVPQYVHYQFRGVQLRDFCLYDYAGCVTVVKKKPAVPDQNTNTGRQQNKTIQFDSRHPLSETYEQRLRSKQFIPILAGAPPPPYPGTPKTSSLWRAAAKRYAQYMLCAFVPWDLETLAPPMELTWQNF